MFDASRYTPAEYYPESNRSLQDDLAPFKVLSEGASSSNPGPDDFLFARQGKFQILHAGLDDVWGDFRDIRTGAAVFPDGPFVGAVADTLTNFTTSYIEDAHE